MSKPKPQKIRLLAYKPKGTTDPMILEHDRLLTDRGDIRLTGNLTHYAIRPTCPSEPGLWLLHVECHIRQGRGLSQVVIQHSTMLMLPLAEL